MEVIQLLMEKTNKYHKEYLDRLHNNAGYSHIPNISVQEMYFYWLYYKWDMSQGHIQKVLRHCGTILWTTLQ
jgi:hypothetical protein